MGKIAIVTDSNSGITQEEAKELGIRVVPMPFYINGELYYEDITLTQDEFMKNWKPVRIFQHLSRHREMLWNCGKNC